MLYNNIQKLNSTKSKLSKIYMLFLALNPLLSWYDISMPLGLGSMILLFLSVISLAYSKLKFSIVPYTLWTLFIYVCGMWCYYNGFEIWTFMPPGGWLFFSFIIITLAGIHLFDYEYLNKIMRWVIFIAIPLFWLQYIMVKITGTAHFCFVPKLTDAFTYQGWSYAEMVMIHVNKTHPCSIFIEKSYMAYYLVAYLSMSLFSKENKSKWWTKETSIIMVTLLLLRSGSGIVGLAVLLLVKLFSIFWNENSVRRILITTFTIPFIIGVLFVYQMTEAGQEVLSRQNEITTEQTSGYVRIIAGYKMFDEMPPEQKIVGMKMSDAVDRFGWVRSDGSYGLYINGVQTILISLGYIGIFLYILFYGSIFRKVNISSKMCIITLLIMSLLESNYLNPYMILLTVIPCGSFLKNKYKYNQLKIR